jgi:putative PEP-CTERM system histidine kinase
MNFGFYSYLGAALAYGFFAALLLFSWRESLQGKLLFITMFISAVWAMLAMKTSLDESTYQFVYQLLENLRYIAWFVFLLKLFETALPAIKQPASSYRKFIRWAPVISIGLGVVLLLNEVLSSFVFYPGQYVVAIIGSVLLSLAGMAIVEQLYRNLADRYRWATKYLFLGAGGIFVFDFYLYTNALLSGNFDQDIWQARGAVHLAVVPLFIIASARNKNWSLNIFVSRDIVLNSSAFLGGGLYLLLMAVAGYYIKEYGGSFGPVNQVVFFSLAALSLVVVLSSSQLRAQIRVFLAKHFYKNKYDYRVEWLQLTENLNETGQDKDYFKTAIEAMGRMVGARSGQLWLRDDEGNYKNVDVWQSDFADVSVADDSSLIRFLTKKKFVINITEIESHKDEYRGLSLPDWLITIEQPWLIVPLPGVNSLQGFIVLARPLVERSINWEDHDLLKTAARQIASYLTVLITSAQLAEAKQFEVFSRLTAYMVHDLKNIAAELELVAKNAKRHFDNPEFISDAFETVENTAEDINRLLMQLRNRRSQAEKKVMVNLEELLADVIKARQHIMPVPRLELLIESADVVLEKGRLYNVLLHLLDNAQQATDDNGEIIVRLSSEDNMYLIQITDTGCGMDDDFIHNRLFRPFDTTKGNAGMGIGMYESREFVRQLGGDISIQSEPEKGSIITLFIPSN